MAGQTTEPSRIMNQFADHFSSVATDYARYRPSYPDALFDHLVKLAGDNAVVWDCATGSGQAALALAKRVATVIATDASAAQIEQAKAHPDISYRVATAENSGLDDHSVNLVTVAQALHWFDLDAFYREVNRVVIPGGLIAAWCYGPPTLPTPALQSELDHFYTEILGPYWPPERALVESGYRDLAFPFQPLPAPQLDMSVEVNLENLIGYLGTWSANRRHIEARGFDPRPELRRRLVTDWGDPNDTKTLRWPLPVRIGRV